jgi:ribosome maturation factor RimP
MPGGIRPAAGPVDEKRLAGLIQPVVAAAGMDLESVRVSMAGKRRLLRIVVDADGGVTLDDTADVSHEISVLLDAANAMGNAPYTLEVSSPGVDRPLTEPRHWRRAARRLVRVKVAGEGTLVGRVLAASDDGVPLDVDGARRVLEYGTLGPGSIQVEFGRLPDSGEDVADDDLDEDELDDDEELGELDADSTNHGGDLDNNEKADLGAGGDGH